MFQPLYDLRHRAEMRSAFSHLRRVEHRCVGRWAGWRKALRFSGLVIAGRIIFGAFRRERPTPGDHQGRAGSRVLRRQRHRAVTSLDARQRRLQPCHLGLRDGQAVAVLLDHFLGGTADEVCVLEFLRDLTSLRRRWPCRAPWPRRVRSRAQDRSLRPAAGSPSPRPARPAPSLSASRPSAASTPTLAPTA